jgi:hypothetical protein
MMKISGLNFEGWGAGFEWGENFDCQLSAPAEDSGRLEENEKDMKDGMEGIMKSKGRID